MPYSIFSSETIEIFQNVSGQAIVIVMGGVRTEATLTLFGVIMIMTVAVEMTT